MTVGAAVPPAFYNGDGVLTQFIIPWTVRNAAYVEAGWVDSAGLWVPKINGTDYSVAFSGGSWRLTFTAPPPVGVNNVVIRRVTPGQQGIAFRDLRRFPAENTEAMGDLLAEAAQDLSTQLLTTFRLAPADHGKLRVMDTLQNAVGKFWTISADPGNPGGFRVDFSPSVAAVEATAAIAAQIVQVAAASASIVIVAQPTNIAGVVTLAPQAANIGLLGPVAAQIGVLGTAPNPANMATLAPVAGNITTVAGNVASVNTVAANIAGVNTVATNIAAVLAVPALAAQTAAYADADVDEPVEGVGVLTFNPATAVNLTTNVITITAHGIEEDEQVTYRHGGGTAMGGLAHDAEYWAVTVTANTLQLSATRGGTPIDLTSNGTGTAHQLLPVRSAKHHAFYAQDSAEASEASAVVALAVEERIRTLSLGDYANVGAAVSANPDAIAFKSIYFNTTSNLYHVITDVGSPASIPLFTNFASQAEAEAGTNNDRGMSPLRTAQAIAALAPQTVYATQAEAEAGTVSNRSMSPLRTAQAIAALAPQTAYASQAEATALSANNRTLSPSVAAYSVFATLALGNSFAVDAEGLTLGGGADATAALAATVAKIPTSGLSAGGEIVVGGGVYPSTAALTLPDYARVRGVTPSSSRLNFAGLSGTGGAILDTTQSYYLGLSNVAIDGPPGYGVDWNDTSSSIIADAEIRPRSSGSTSGGVRLRERSYLTTVERVRVVNSRAIAFVVDNPSTGVNTSILHANNYAHGSQLSGYLKSALVYSLDLCNAADDCLEWGYVYENMNCHVALANGVERATMAPLRLRASTSIADQCSIAAVKDLRNLTFIGVFATDCGDGSTHPTFADIQALDGRTINATFINCYTDNVGGGGSPVGIRVDGSAARAFILGEKPGGSIDHINGGASGRYGFNGRHEWDLDDRLVQAINYSYTGTSPTRTRQTVLTLEADGTGVDRNSGTVNGAYSAMEADVYSGGASWHAYYMTARRARGTKASPAQINANDILFAIDVFGRGSSGWARACQVNFAQDNASPGGTLRGTIAFACANNTTNAETVLQLFSDKTARFYGNAVPNANGTLALGSGSLRWDLFADVIDATGAAVITSTANSIANMTLASTGDVTNHGLHLTTTHSNSGARNAAITLNGTAFGVIDFRFGTNAGDSAMTGGTSSVVASITNAGKLDLTGPIEFRPGSSQTPAANGDVTFDTPSNTQFRISHRGSDGTVRTNTLTLA